jgi:predicted  nucleic acid-binding Zn-ribbon protein
MTETLAELKARLDFLERRMSKVQQYSELEHSVVNYANEIAALREKIKKIEAGNTSKGSTSP